MGEWTWRVVPREAGLTLLLTGAALTGLSCGGGDVTTPPTTGSLTITTSTSGPEPDADGYAVTIDGGTETAIPASGTLQRDNVESGNHSIQLSGMAANCTVAGDNPRSVSVSTGQTVTVTFELTCSATTGSLQITTTTSGSEPDPDGYTVGVDNGASQAIGLNTSLTINGLAPGQHTVQLAGLAGNCRVVGDNPSSVTVIAGNQATVVFSLECPSPTLRWQEMRVPDGYDLYSVWASAGTDVYALGSLQHAMATFMVHYDGHTWSTVAILTDNISTQGEPKNLDPSEIWGSSASDVVLVGFDFDSQDAAAVHYDGHVWSAMARLGVGNPTETGGTFAHFSSVWGTSRTDVFAVGGISFADNANNVSQYHPLAARYDGTSWSRMTLPSDGYWLVDVWGASGRDVYAVGVDPIGTPPAAPFILHYDGSQWAKMPIDYPGEFSLAGVWASSPTDIFAVGQVGSSSTGAIFHYDGHSWSLMASPRTTSLSDVWGTSGSNLIAISGDAILHYDGKAWSKVANRGGAAIWGNSSSDVFVAGEGGLILHGTP